MINMGIVMMAMGGGGGGYDDEKWNCYDGNGCWR